MTINQRTILFANYIIENQATVRDTAAHYGYGKSTVHNNVTERLRELDFPLYKKVKKVLEQNYSEKHLRGGESTKQRFFKGDRA